MARTRNDKLVAVIKEIGWSQAQLAAHFCRVAGEAGAEELLSVTRSHVSQWILGSRPSGRAPHILCEALSRGLGRRVTLAQIGLAEGGGTGQAPDWTVDTLAELSDLGSDVLAMHRRKFLGKSVYSVGGLALPGEQWWHQAAERAAAREPRSRHRVGRGEVEAVREMVGFFQRRDQRRGGGHGRSAVVAYLNDEVSTYLGGTFADDSVRQQLYSAVGELVYLTGWMAFDAGRHADAQRFFISAVKLAAEAGNPALEGHVLRAMAHQAVDLGHPRQALEMAEASMSQRRYAQASPRERALLAVVHARSLAAAGQGADAATALLRAEDDLAAADPGQSEPERVFFFAEASLAHEAACTLRDLGDLKGAQRQFKRSVRLRKAATFTRTHAVTLGYLGAVEAQQGEVEAACVTWTRALEAMDGVRSGRALDTVTNMRRVLSPFRRRGVAAVAEVDSRAAAILRRVT